MQRCGHRDDSDVEVGAHVGLIRRRVATGCQCGLQLGVGNVGSERCAVGKVLHALDIEVEADDVESGGDGSHGQRQTDVALADNDDPLRRERSPMNGVHVIHRP